MDLIILFIISVLACYIYAFVSGFTDAVQAIAEPIGARVLSPHVAVVMAGVLELVGALSGTAVALTIGKGIVSLELVSLLTVPAAIFGAMTWSLITYYFGLPVSETHGLIGGLIGAALVIGGAEAVNWVRLLPIVSAIFVAPALGFAGGLVFMGLIDRLFWSAPASKMRLIFNNLQRAASAFLAYSHGLNDAQKPMGVLTMALALHYGWKDPTVPLWVILTVGATASLGVAYGGWRIIKTLGMRITRLTPEQGFISNLSASIVLQIASALGIPVSTTHVDASALVGTGATRRLYGVWEIVRNMFISWILTLPAAILFGAIYATILNLL